MKLNVRQHYLTKVLGLRLPLVLVKKEAVLNYDSRLEIPSELAIKNQLKTTSDNILPTQNVVVASAVPWTTEAQMLVSKMMSAIGIHEFFFHDKVETEISENAHWVTFGEYNSSTRHKTLKLSSMDQFFSPFSDEEIQSLKKQTWLDLKKFKQEIFK
jgi:hypothetical protein